MRKNDDIAKWQQRKLSGFGKLCSHRHGEPFEKPVIHIGTLLPITRPVFNNSYITALGCLFWRDFRSHLLKIDHQAQIPKRSRKKLTKKATREPSRWLFNRSPCALLLTGIVLRLFRQLMRSPDFYKFLVSFARFSAKNREFLTRSPISHQRPFEARGKSARAWHR